MKKDNSGCKGVHPVEKDICVNCGKDFRIKNMKKNKSIPRQEFDNLKNSFDRENKEELIAEVLVKEGKRLRIFIGGNEFSIFSAMIEQYPGKPPVLNLKLPFKTKL